MKTPIHQKISKVRVKTSHKLEGGICNMCNGQGIGEQDIKRT